VSKLSQEISEGKLLIDAAKAAGVKGIVWSGLVSVNKISGGKHPYVCHFDGKAVVSEYGRASGVPFVDVQAGFYATNFLANPTMLGKQPDGTYAIAWAIRPTTVLPIIDIEHDYGLYVQRALEQPVFPDGEEVYTTSEDITVEDMARQLSEGKPLRSWVGAKLRRLPATGEQVVFKQISVEEWTKAFAAMGLPPVISNEIIDGFRFFDEVGCECWAAGDRISTDAFQITGASRPQVGRAWRKRRAPGRSLRRRRTGVRHLCDGPSVN
jgi:hypothetical protein